MAGPLVFVLALGGFLLLVSLVIGVWFWVYLSVSLSNAERQSDILVHLRHRSAGLSGLLRAAVTDGDHIDGHRGRRHLGAGLLSAADGSAVRHQCADHHSVSGVFFVLVSLSCSCGVIFGFHSRRGIAGTIFAGLCIVWCALSASKLFVTAYSMEHQQMLIAYPCALLYGVFALITVF